MTLPEWSIDLGGGECERVPAQHGRLVEISGIPSGSVESWACVDFDGSDVSSDVPLADLIREGA